ncbi:glycoside hydrolase family 5 protein [Euryhalocaulis caribicus]|uniref:glycoside hydrolase family 5 protein n=1 Tax=Euryhalocaulis caribicus TaxID=1161401 RepID=UPI0003A15CD1|nr:glycoside hydrolase family 5 protein [Euryhalocaulis caribicus]
MRWMTGMAALAVAACGAEFAPDVSEAPVAPTASRAEFPVQRCVNLANALNAPVEGDWGYAITQGDLQTIADGGFDTVRVLIDWHSHALEAAPYTVDPERFARIDEVIAQAFEADLNVIIDMHSYTDMKDRPDFHAPRVLAIWRQIGERYRDYPDSLIFEPVNEPIRKLSGEKWFALAEELVDAIRETNPARTIILGGDDWSSVEGLMRLRLPDDPYLVATFHYYEPFDFTHQGASWFKNAPPVGTGFGASHEIEAVQHDIAKAQDWAERNRTPVFLGEFGPIRHGETADRAVWTKTVREAAEAGGMGWCYFDFTAGFDIYDSDAGDWVAPVHAALMED